MNQFNVNCGALHNIERNLSATADEALRAAQLSSGRVIQTDDGAQWQHDVDLTDRTSICHQRPTTGLKFAIVECLPLKSREMRDVLNSGNNVKDVLQSFVRDQRQVLRLWKDDVTAQVREHLAEKYPQENMDIVVGSFEIKLARAISETYVNTQSQSRGIRI
jgi:urease gamma subunit